MAAFFPDQDDERLPPGAVRLLELTAILMSDGQRIQVHLNLTPFSRPPFIELLLTDPEGETCGGASIIEPTSWEMDLTMHIRRAHPIPGHYSLSADLSYPDLGVIDRRKVEFITPTE